MRQRAAPVPEPPAGCTYTPFEWRQWVQIVRHDATPGEPVTVPEERGRLRITWAVDAHAPVRVQRLAVLDPDARATVWLERWLHARFDGRILGVSHVAAGLTVALLAAIVLATHNAFGGRISLTLAGALAALLALPLVSRKRRLWRTIDAGWRADEALARFADAVAEADALALRLGDGASREAAVRLAWERAGLLDAPPDLPAPDGTRREAVVAAAARELEVDAELLLAELRGRTAA